MSILTEKDALFMAKKVWDESSLCKVLYPMFDEYSNAVALETVRWNAMSEVEQKQLQEKILARIDKVIAKLTELR